jgi:hypothetical protein
MANILSMEELELAAEALWVIEGGEPVTMRLKDYGEKSCTFSFIDPPFQATKRYGTSRLIDFYFE